jgi:integrase
MPVVLSQQVLDKAKRDSATGRAYDVTDARAPGLVLRVGKTGLTWTFRGRKHQTFVRVRLGSVDLLSLTVAREIAGAAMSQLRDTPYPPDDDWVRRWLLGKRLIAEPPKPAPPTVSYEQRERDTWPGWTFAEARDAYLEEVRRTRREATWRDRKSMLNLKELAPLESRKVGLITRYELAAVVAAIHRSGRERHAAHLAECLRPMWGWLGRDAQQLQVYLKPGNESMAGLRAPERTNREGEEGQGTYVPPPAELGLILAIARSGALHPTLAAAVELLLMTAQRRRTIVPARRVDFVEEDGQLVWRIPPTHRKTARRLGSRRTHDLPLVGGTAERVRALLTAGESDYLFPGVRPRRAGGTVGHLSPDALTHCLEAMPGVTATPHDVRRGLTTHGQDVLGLGDDEIKLVLDHSEGRGSQDVTEGSYSKARRLARKAAVLEPWAALLEAEAAEVTLDAEAVKAAMTETRRKREASAKKAA